MQWKTIFPRKSDQVYGKRLKKSKANPICGEISFMFLTKAYLLKMYCNIRLCKQRNITKDGKLLIIGDSKLQQDVNLIYEHCVRKYAKINFNEP